MAARPPSVRGRAASLTTEWAGRPAGPRRAKRVGVLADVTRRVTEPHDDRGVWHNGSTPNREGLAAPTQGR